MPKRYQQTENVLLKIIVCGESRVGKSLMCHRLSTNDSDDICESRFIRRTSSVGYSAVPYEPTIGLDMAVLKRRLSTSTVAKIHLWDTSGDDKFIGIVRSYYRGCCAAVVVVDMSDEDARSHAFKWIKDLRSQKRQDGRAIIIAVFGDIGNGIHPKNSDIAKQCEKKNVYYSEMELRQNRNVEMGFGTLLNMVYDTYISQGLEVHGIGAIGGSSNTAGPVPISNGIHPLLPNNGSSQYGTAGNDQNQRCCSIL